MSILIANNIDDIKQRCVSIFRKHSVIRANIFGSFARGEQKSSSDVDFLVEFDPFINEKLNIMDTVRLIMDLETILLRKVDVMEFSQLEKCRDSLKTSIEKHQIKIL